MTSATRSYQRDDLLKSRHILDAVLSPDGAFAIYQLSEIEQGKTPDEDRQVSALWRVDLNGGEPRRLTAKEPVLATPQLTPDGRFLLFLTARGGAPQVWRLPLDGGETEAVTALEQGITAFQLSPDGEQLALVAADTPALPIAGGHKRVSRHAWRLDAVPGYLEDTRHAIYLATVSGGEPRRLTEHDGIVPMFEWSPTGQEIAAMVLSRGRHTTSALFGDLCVVSLQGEERTLVSAQPVSAILWTPDGDRIGFVAPPEADLTRQAHLWLIDRTGGKPVDRTPTAGIAVNGSIQPGSPAWWGRSRLLPSADGADVLVPVASGGHVGLWRIALSDDEACERVIEGARTCKLLARAGARILFAAQDFTTPTELFVADLNTGEERALTRHNDAWCNEIAWPRVERVAVTSDPGIEVEGWVMVPQEGGTPYQTVLFIHGGPHSGWGATFNEDFLEMAGAGYAVAFANPRGSTGYGDGFSQAIVGCWGDPEFNDFDAFVNELVKRGVADPDRLGITGVSGGGQLTAWIIGHTDRFKAAVPEQGVYNMISMYGVSDVGVDLIPRELGGAPHQRPELYWERSPVAHAHHCTTPTLLIQGENDIRCPMEQAEQLYTVLKQSGCEVEFLRLANCNHALQIAGPPALRRTRMDALKEWFGRHMP